MRTYILLAYIGELQTYSFFLACQSPVAPLNGLVLDDGDTATYTCGQGYSLSGLSKRTCATDGTGWSGADPACSKFIHTLSLHENIYVPVVYKKCILCAFFISDHNLSLPTLLSYKLKCIGIESLG